MFSALSVGRNPSVEGHVLGFGKGDSRRMGIRGLLPFGGEALPEATPVQILVEGRVMVMGQNRRGIIVIAGKPVGPNDNPTGLTIGDRIGLPGDFDVQFVISGVVSSRRHLGGIAALSVICGYATEVVEAKQSFIARLSHGLVVSCVIS